MKEKAFRWAKRLGLIPDIRPHEQKAVGHSVSMRIQSTITREGVRYSKINEDPDEDFDEYFNQEAIRIVRQMLIGFLWIVVFFLIVLAFIMW